MPHVVGVGVPAKSIGRSVEECSLIVLGLKPRRVVAVGVHTRWIPVDIGCKEYMGQDYKAVGNSILLSDCILGRSFIGRIMLQYLLHRLERFVNLGN